MKIKKWLASLGLIGLFAVSSVSAKTDPETDRKSLSITSRIATAVLK